MGRTIDAEDLYRTVGDVIAIGKAEEWPEWMFNLTGVDNEPLFPSTGNRTNDILQGIFRALNEKRKAEGNVRLISEIAEKLLAGRRLA